MTLQHGLVESHDTAFVFRRKRFIEVLIIGELVHEGEEEGDKVTIPDVEMDVLILFGLEERDGVDLDLAERGLVEGKEDAMQNTAKIFFIQS